MDPRLDRKLLATSWRAFVTYDKAPPGQRWLVWLWTALLALALASLFTLLGMLAFGVRGSGSGSEWAEPARWAQWFGKNLVVAATIAVLIRLLFEALAGWARPRLPRWSMAQRAVFFSGVPMAGVVVGWPVGLWLSGVDIGHWWGSTGGQHLVLASFALSLLICALTYQFFRLKADRFLAEKRATEAQLRLLQAQIEPHFLFNTLANVHSLIEHDAAQARAMLGAFTDYLRASLNGLRRDQATLADELALAEAYLRVQQTRMEERLSWRIDADEAARRVTMLPLLLQPLIENALHHGLERKVQGGHIEVRAWIEGAWLTLEVRDDGLGLTANQGSAAALGSGMALSNIRQRLAAHFGDAASLELLAAEPGALARLRLPVSSHSSIAHPAAPKGSPL